MTLLTGTGRLWQGDRLLLPRARYRIDKSPSPLTVRLIDPVSVHVLTSDDLGRAVQLELEGGRQWAHGFITALDILADHVDIIWNELTASKTEGAG